MQIDAKTSLSHGSLAHEITHHILASSYGYTSDFIFREIPSMGLSETLLDDDRVTLSNNAKGLIEYYAGHKDYIKMKEVVLPIVSQLPVCEEEILTVLDYKKGVDIPIGAVTVFNYMMASALAILIKERYGEKAIVEVYRAGCEAESKISDKPSRFRFDREEMAKVITKALSVDVDEVRLLLHDAAKVVWGVS